MVISNSLIQPMDNIQKDLSWWQKGITYQIYPRSFLDTSGNGIGDLQGIIEKLDYLNDGTDTSLGIDAIWISPFYPSPMADFGYDVSDYCDVHPLFGDLDTFDRLIKKAHHRQIKVIIDYVPNHTSDQHAWFLESRSNRNNLKRNWYIWRDAKPDGSPPNNWGSVFGGPAWTRDKLTDQYFLHQFLKEQPELNWRNPEVRMAMYDVLRFWLDRGVDGFRMDVVGFLIKDEQFRDNPPSPNEDQSIHPNNIYARQSHKFNEDQDEVHEIIHQLRRILDQYPNLCGIGEVGYNLERWLRYYGDEGNGLHLPFNFRLMHLPWETHAIGESVQELEAVLPSDAWPNYVLGNHDQPRMASRIGEQQARIAAMLLLTLRGTPTLYYGDELGMLNGIIPAEALQDPQGTRLGFENSRDVARTPMQWDGSINAGFSQKEPWLPVGADFKHRNVALQNKNSRSILNLYRRLVWYRKVSPALLSGSFHAVDAGTDDCLVYRREHPTRECLIALNFVDRTHKLSLSDKGNGELVISTHLDRQESVSLTSLTLRPNEGVIIELNL
jgi:alpha-glucosidase